MAAEVHEAGPYRTPAEIEKPRAYCDQCEYYKEASHVVLDACRCPANLVDTYRTKGGRELRRPDSINRDNDCRYFQVRHPGPDNES